MEIVCFLPFNPVWTSILQGLCRAPFIPSLHGVRQLLINHFNLNWTPILNQMTQVDSQSKKLEYKTQKPLAYFQHNICDFLPSLSGRKKWPIFVRATTPKM
jgi:hypothetical protein